MAKYLFEARLTAEGARGTVQEGGTSRREAVRHLAESLGGRREAFYYAFGGVDAYVIVDYPDTVTAAAVALAVSQSGAVSGKTVVLITPEEMDEAVKKTVSYRPPGGDPMVLTGTGGQAGTALDGVA